MKVPETLYVISHSFDPWINLSIEEYLLDTVKENQVIFYLWQNKNTVVIGRNQNAWREARTEKLHQDGGRLARRLSGGGAVFHDDGNLNFTFIMRKELYDQEKQFNVILKALEKLDITAELSGRNDILVDGRKFSGNAFYHGKIASYHHGTILVDADMTKLGEYLNVSKAKLKSKGVKSVKSRVINLRELNPELTIEKIKEAMKASFEEIYAALTLEESTEDILKIPEFKRYHEKYSSRDWIFGKSPNFDFTAETRFNWGSIELGLSINAGKIKEAKFFSDAMDADLVQKLSESLAENDFSKDKIAARLRTLDKDSTEIIEELTGWIETLDI